VRVGGGTKWIIHLICYLIVRALALHKLHRCKSSDISMANI